MITDTNATSRSCAKPTLANGRCGPGLGVRLRRAPSKSCQSESLQPTMVLKAKGLDEMTREASVRLEKRRGSRQGPHVVQHPEFWKRRIPQVRLGRDGQ